MIDMPTTAHAPPARAAPRSPTRSRSPSPSIMHQRRMPDSPDSSSTSSRPGFRPLDTPENEGAYGYGPYADDGLGFFERARRTWRRERLAWSQVGLGGLTSADRTRTAARRGLQVLSPRDRALWRWVNVDDLDGFLREVYSYYVGQGIWCISLSRLLNLL